VVHKLLIPIILILLLVKHTNAQSFSWAKGEGGIGNEAANSITVDEQGNSYITGNIAGVAEFSGTEYQGRGIYDIFIAKYDVSGNVVWVKTAGGDDNEQGEAIKYKNNYLYVSGYFSDTCWFQNEMIVSLGQSDAFVAKYDLQGNLVWVRLAGGTGEDHANALDVDDDGNVYAGGNYERAMNAGSIQLNTTNIYKESFFISYSANGDVNWAKSGLGNGVNQITGIAFNHHQGIYLTGFFSNTLQLAQLSVNSNTSSHDVFLARVNTDGDLIWIKKAGSAYEDNANGVCSDLEGNATITGYFSGTAMFDNNSVTYIDYNDIFVAHYDSSGNNIWVKAGKGQQLDIGFAVTSDDDGDIFVTGMFQGLINFDGSILNGYDRDVFLISYDKNGNIRWINQAGASDTDCGLGISVTPSGKVCIAGYYRYNCFFGTTLIEYAHYNDLFIAQFNPSVLNAINELFSDNLISVYPNPVRQGNDVYIERPEEINSVNVYNALGMSVWQGDKMRENRVKTSNLQSGTYFISVSIEGEKRMAKLIIQ
jgi:hypothetical protein